MVIVFQTVGDFRRRLNRALIDNGYRNGSTPVGYQVRTLGLLSFSFVFAFLSSCGRLCCLFFFFFATFHWSSCFHSFIRTHLLFSPFFFYHLISFSFRTCFSMTIIFYLLTLPSLLFFHYSNFFLIFLFCFLLQRFPSPLFFFYPSPLLFFLFLPFASFPSPLFIVVIFLPLDSLSFYASSSTISLFPCSFLSSLSVFTIIVLSSSILLP